LLLYGFPRWLSTLTETLPQGQTLPNLAEHSLTGPRAEQKKCFDNKQRHEAAAAGM
jgi:hypothetical protein